MAMACMLMIPLPAMQQVQTSSRYEGLALHSTCHVQPFDLLHDILLCGMHEACMPDFLLEI